MAYYRPKFNQKQNDESHKLYFKICDKEAKTQGNLMLYTNQDK